MATRMRVRRLVPHHSLRTRPHTVVAVLVAGIGIIGLVAFTVSQCIKEIAIRMALGAGKVQLLTAVLRQFVWPVAIGIAVGAGSLQRPRDCCGPPFTE